MALGIFFSLRGLNIKANIFFGPPDSAKLKKKKKNVKQFKLFRKKKVVVKRFLSEAGKFIIHGIHGKRVFI